MNCWFLSWRRSPWWTIAKKDAMQTWVKKLRRRWIQRCWRDWLQPQVAKSSNLAIRNSLCGKKYAKISTKPRDLCFFGLLPQDDQVQQDDLIGALWVWQKRVGDGKISRKTWWDPMGWISWRLLRQWDLTNLLRSRGSKPAAGMLQKCGWPGDWVCCWRFFVGVVEISGKLWVFGLKEVVSWTILGHGFKRNRSSEPDYLS